MLDNIPAELRALTQWVCAGPDKVPINPRTGRHADPTDPGTWATFAEAVGAGMAHVGFALSATDPYCIIDLDAPKNADQAARHSKIFNAFTSYVELSQSGTGVHIVTRGRVPCGVRRDRVEVYSDARYMIFTGKVLRNYPIADCQNLLDSLWQEMGGHNSAAGAELDEGAESNLSDEEVLERGSDAVNGDKFDALCNGEWQSMYSSQSEADYGLLSMLAFYSPDNAQVRRLFRFSALGKRDKAQRDDYLNRSLRKIRANQPPDVDLSAVLPAPVSVPDAPQPPPIVETTAGAVTPRKGSIPFPPGLVGDVAGYILQTATRPVPEIALSASLALFAGIAGRCYNVSGTGLNQYIMTIAKTGSGKEGAASGIDQLVAATRQKIPSIDSFIGPAAFASGQALVRVIATKPSFVSVLGEIGLTLQQICDPNAPGPLVMLRRVLLDVYNKSGHNKVLRESVYSDTEKNTKIVNAPSLTILGESTPETFYGGLDESHIAEGLIPRFLVIEYTGKRPPINHNAFFPPPVDLLERFADFSATCIATNQNGQCCPVQFEPAAQRLLDAFEIEATAKINDEGGEAECQLWNRAHLKALKIAALIAVGCGHHAPTVTLAIAEWSLGLIRHEIGGVLSRFKSGEAGTGEEKQAAELVRLINRWFAMPAGQRVKYRVNEELAKRQVVPFHYLNVYARRLACFKRDRRGAARALELGLDNMVKCELLQQMPVQQAFDEFKTRSPLYVTGQAW